jgi:predicted nucleotidyltransferase
MASSANFGVYNEAVRALESHHIPYVIGGGIAVMAFGRKRDTKDIDLYIADEDVTRALEVLAGASFEVDPMPSVNWLSKAYKNGITVDFILENIGGIHTNDETLRRGFRATINGYKFTIMAPEDLIIRKVMAMRSDRHDWFDCISVLSCTYPMFDWAYFIRLAEVSFDRILSFLLYVRSDREHVIPIPDSAVRSLMEKISTGQT